MERETNHDDFKVNSMEKLNIGLTEPKRHDPIVRLQHPLLVDKSLRSKDLRVTPVV
jgi:hypothetical protein